MLSLEEGTALVKIARQAFFTYLTDKRSFTLPDHSSLKFEQRTGAYVRIGTFAEQGQPNKEVILGFTGYPMPPKCLDQSVVDASTSIAVRSALPPSSTDEISFEVTVLSLAERLKAFDPLRIASEIKLGMDAVMVGTPDLKRAIILPQTAVKTCSNEVEFLGECCTAAGLMADAWLTSPDISFYRFQTEIFREIGSEKDVVRILLTELK